MFIIFNIIMYRLLSFPKIIKVKIKVIGNNIKMNNFKNIPWFFLLYNFFKSEEIDSFSKEI